MKPDTGQRLREKKVSNASVLEGEGKQQNLPSTREDHAMRPNILRIETVAVLLAVFAVPLPQAEARSRPSLKSVASKREKQIHKLEQRLEKPYGSDACFVFAFTVVQPDCSHEVVLIAGRYRRTAYAQTRMSHRLVFRVRKVQGARAAAELIWQAQHTPLPLRFVYRGFENEAQADAFHKFIDR